MPFEAFDIWDQARLTDTIKLPRDGNHPFRAREDEAFLLGERIAPLKPHRGRSAKIEVESLRPFGQAQFRAPDATPPLWKPPGFAREERLIELVLIDEMERINEEDWLKLTNPDEDVRRSAGAELVDRGRMMELRNLRRTEWMRWQAFSGQLTVTYPTGASFIIDYGLPSGHKPTAGTLWSTVATADPIADLRTWSELLATDSGYVARYAHMSSKTYDYLARNEKVLDSINMYNPNAPVYMFPRSQDINAIFETFAPGLEIVLYNNGFRPEGGSGVGTINRYLPDGKVLLTTDYTIEGINIADTLDGEVVVSAGYNETDTRIGWQSEVMLDHISKNRFFRSASARIPRLLVPEAFVYATVA